MSDKEQKAADALLDKLQAATADEVVQLGTAYHALAQGALCRKQAEANGK